MTGATPAIRTLARRLIALEEAGESIDGQLGSAVRACDRLRAPLSKLVGVAGFRSLMSRALALATAEVPWLESVLIRPDGVLEATDTSRQHQDSSSEGEAGVVVVAQLLGLLVAFVGTPLTLILVGDAWPDASVTGMDAESGEGR